MADVIRLKDGSVHTVFDERDALELVRDYMGDDIHRWFEYCLSDREDDGAYIEDLEKEADGLRDHHREVMAELREQSEIIAGLIREKDIDRRALSTAAGKIGTITWRELR